MPIHSPDLFTRAATTTKGHALEYAKAYAALIGTVATTLLGIYTADTTVGKILTVVAAVCSAVAVAKVSNTAPTNEGGNADAGLILLVGTFVGVVLILFGVRLG